jgi:hypothetical protein
MVQLADYQVNMGQEAVFGSQTSIEELDNLNKALAAEEITGRDTTNLTTASGAPLKVESLEKTLKVLTWSSEDMTIWKNIPQSPAYNTVEEYNQLTSYGNDQGGFNNEGELPIEDDSTYVRRAQLVKFLGVTKSVTHPMQLVNTMVGNIIEREIKNGTLWILRKLDRALYIGDDTMVPQEFNGLCTQHAQNDAFSSLEQYMTSTSIIDCRGATLQEGNIEDAVNSIVENYGRPSQMYAPPKVLSDFVKNFYGNKFIQPNTPALTDGIMGQRVKSFESQFGNIGLNYDLFFNKEASKTYNAGGTNPAAPAAPTAVSITAVSADAQSDWASTDAGNYIYGVTAQNRYGESAMCILSGTPTAIVAGGAVDLMFTASASTYPGTCYKIYRSQKGATSAATSTMYFLFKVNVAGLAAGWDGAAVNTVRDKNRWMPSTNQAFICQWDTEVVEFKQLAPLMKMDLAITSPAYRFMVLMYGTPFLYAPLKMTRIINIAG